MGENPLKSDNAGVHKIVDGDEILQSYSAKSTMSSKASDHRNLLNHKKQSTLLGGLCDYLFGSNFDGRHEWTPGIMVMAAIFIGAVVGLLVAALQQVLAHFTEFVWVIIPEYFCSPDDISNCPSGLWTYNIAAIFVLWGLAGLAMIFFDFPGPNTPGLPVLLGAIHTKGTLCPKQGLGSWNMPLTIARIWIVNFFFITGATSIGPEAQCMLTGALFASWFAERAGQDQFVRSSRILVQCGMASGLACFFSLPTSSVIFALELPNKGLGYVEGMAAVLAAASTGVVVNAAVQGMQWGGGTLAVSGEASLMVPTRNTHILIGVVCGIIGLFFAKLWLHAVALAKSYMKKLHIEMNTNKWMWLASILVLAAVTGVVSAVNPYTMFYSETEIGTIFTMGQQPLPHYSPVLYGISQFGSATPVELKSWELLVTGLLKLFNIVVCACYFPGGVIWPLYYAGMCIGGAFATWLKMSPDLVFLYMLATGVAVEAPVLKNPLGAALVMMMQVATSKPPVAMASALEACVIAGLISWGFTYNLPYFPPDKQKARSLNEDMFDFMGADRAVAVGAAEEIAVSAEQSL